MILLFLVTGQVQFLFHHVCLFMWQFPGTQNPLLGVQLRRRKLTLVEDQRWRMGEAN